MASLELVPHRSSTRQYRDCCAILHLAKAPQFHVHVHVHVHVRVCVLVHARVLVHVLVYVPICF
jgi:hypothetical protein